LPGELEITFLGTGTSHGIPMIGCSCPVCTSADPRDKRNRAAAVVRLPAAGPANGRVILIDTPPELRLSAIALGLRQVDAVLFTHGHADHILGMDDLRRFNNLLDGTIDCYADADTVATLRRVFGYAERPYDNPDRPSVTFSALDGPADVCGVTVTPVPLMHGRRRILGYRIGDFAYCTDCSAIPAASRPLLEGLELLVLGALRITPHPAHFNIAQALEAIEKIRPRRALLTHIAHESTHADLAAMMPDGVEPAYDGLRVRVPTSP